MTAAAPLAIVGDMDSLGEDLMLLSIRPDNGRLGNADKIGFGLMGSELVRLAGTDGMPGKGFTLPDLRKMEFNDRVYSGELWRNQLVSYCEQNPTLVGSSGPVDVSAACPVLKHWDLHANLDSRGDVPFQRFATHLLGAVPVAGTPDIYSTPFDVSDPVNTPSGLNTSNPLVGQSLADAVTDLRSSNIPLDAPPGIYRGEVRADDGDRAPARFTSPGSPHGHANA